MQPLGGDQKRRNQRRGIFNKKESFIPFCFSTLHSIIPNLSVEGVVAGTTPVTIHEEATLSSKGIGGNCGLLTDEIQASSFAIAELSVNFWVNLMLPGALHFYL